MRARRVKSFQFTLHLRLPVGVDPWARFDDIANALFETGCDDGTLSGEGDRLAMTFTREAASLEAAILSAVRDVESGCGCGLSVARVDIEDEVTAAEIAERLGRTRESVRLLANGQRGPGGFPSPVYASKRSKVWRWSDVASWGAQHGLLSGVDAKEAAITLAINGALALRAPNLPPSARRRILEAVGV